MLFDAGQTSSATDGLTDLSGFPSMVSVGHCEIASRSVGTKRTVQGIVRLSFVKTPGLRLLHDLRRSLHDPPTSLPRRNSAKDSETTVALADSGATS
jgi:hypothetical protein